MNDRVIVIGSSGQVAQSLKRITGENFYFIGRPDFDIRNTEKLKILIDEISPSIIINASAYTFVDLAEEESEMAYEINANSIYRVAKICNEKNLPLIHISTDYVFDGNANKPYLEDDLTNPTSVYGKSKLLGEEKLKESTNKHIILRTSWVFSEYGNNFLKTMLKLAKNNKEISVVNDQVGCPTYALNIADAINIIVNEILSEPNNVKYGTYHYTDSPIVSWYEFALNIFEVLKNKSNFETPIVKPIPSIEYKTKATRPMYSVLNCDMIKKNFSIEQKDWRDCLFNCIEYNVDKIF